MLLASFDPLYFVAFDLGYVWSFVRSFDLRHFGLNIFILSSGPFFLWIECLIKYKTWSCQKIYLPIIVST